MKIWCLVSFKILFAKFFDSDNNKNFINLFFKHFYYTQKFSIQNFELFIQNFLFKISNSPQISLRVFKWSLTQNLTFVRKCIWRTSQKLKRNTIESELRFKMPLTIIHTFFCVFLFFIAPQQYSVQINHSACWDVAQKSRFLRCFWLGDEEGDNGPYEFCFWRSRYYINDWNLKMTSKIMQQFRKILKNIKHSLIWVLLPKLLLKVWRKSLTIVFKFFMSVIIENLLFI